MELSTTTKRSLIAVAALAVVGVGIFVVRSESTIFANDDEALLESAQLDSDADGLTDRVEQEMGTNPYLADTDNDGYTDGEEVQAGYDPLTTESDDQLDVDNDGLTGKDERAFGTNPRLADTDFDGVPDGVEVVQGTDAGTASIDSLPDYLGVNVAEERDASLYPAVHPDDFAKIESLSNASSFEEFQGQLEPLVGNAVTVGGPGEVTYNTSLQPRVSDRTDQAFVQAYFNRVGLVAAKYSPVIDTESLAQFGNSTNLREPETRADFVRRLESARTDLETIEVPNVPELVELHTDALQMVDAAYGVATQLENLNVSNATSLQEALRLMNTIQSLIARLQDDIFPRMQSVAANYQFDVPTSLNAFLN